MDTTHSTYKAVFVRYVIGQLQFVERNDFLHPLLSGRWRIRMYVHSFRHFRIRFSGHHPTAAGKKLNANVRQLSHIFSCW